MRDTHCHRCGGDPAYDRGEDWERRCWFCRHTEVALEHDFQARLLARYMNKVIEVLQPTSPSLAEYREAAVRSGISGLKSGVPAEQLPHFLNATYGSVLTMADLEQVSGLCLELLPYER